MKKIKNSLAIVSICCVMYSCSSPTNPNNTLENYNISSNLPDTTVTSPKDSTKGKKIKLAILLDTSGSMDGLLEQAKLQLWNIVMQLAKAKDNEGKDPVIELALYHYGNDDLSVRNAYVQKLSNLTQELDEISEKLFALQTNGGEEYCGAVIQAAIKELEWSKNPDDLNVIYIAGNEPFNQGDVHYEKICALAKQKNIVLNTIYCGEYNLGINEYWKHGAELTGGMYMVINHNDKIVDIATPYDQKIANLNAQLNTTYVSYGFKGRENKLKQEREDLNARNYSDAKIAERAISKSSKVYNNISWDIVDAFGNEPEKITQLTKENLAEEMQNLSAEEKISLVKKLKTKRLQITKEINEINKLRNDFVIKERQKLSQTNVDDVIGKSIKTLAQQKGFVFTQDIN